MKISRTPSPYAPFSLGPFSFGLFSPGLIIACVLLVPAVARAQDEPSDQQKLIAGLAEMQLEPVIEMLVADLPSSPEEAAAFRDALIGGYLERDSVYRDFQVWLNGVRWVIKLQDGMYNHPDYASYYARPMWGADFAQRMLSTLRFRSMAQEFALLGFCSAEQRQAVDLIAGKSYSFLQTAEDEFYMLRTTLSRQGDALQKLINNGKWGRLEDYTQLQIPYYRAQSAALLATQTNAGPYFTGKKDADAERKRLLTEAAGDATRVLEKAKNSGLPDEQLGSIHLLRSIVAGQQGQPAEAIKHADAGLKLELGEQSQAKFLLTLAKAQALTAAGKAGESKPLLEGMLNDPFVTSQPLHIVLVSDQLFRIPMTAALQEKDVVKRTVKIGEAFDVYTKRLGEADLGEWRAGVEGYVENRYEQQLKDMAVEFHADALPAPLKLAQVKASFAEGDELLQANQTDAAHAKYQQAIETAANMLQEADLSDKLRAEGMFFRGLSHFKKGEAGHAANTLIELADRFPDNPRGLVAIQVAFVNITSFLYQNSPDSDVVKQLHSKAFEVLLNKYPNTDLAKQALYEYAAFLRVQSQYAKAIEWYEKVPRDHAAYLEALFERLACLVAVWAEVRDNSGARRIVKAADDFIEAADGAMSSRDADSRAVLRRYTVSALLYKAQVQIETTEQYKQAELALERVTTDYKDVPGSGARIMGLRIRLFQKQGDYNKAEQLLREFMNADPKQAGPLALQVLQSLNGEISALAEAKQQPEKVARLADIATNLATNLVIPWVDRQPEYTPSQKLAFELLHAESLRAAGKYDDALKAYAALEAKYGNIATSNFDVVLGKAECQYHLGDYLKASRAYTKIITDRKNQQLFDRTYWQAEMRFVQSWDGSMKGKLNAKIARYVDPQLTRRDSNLGGEPFRTELLRLRDKHRKAN